MNNYSKVLSPLDGRYRKYTCSLEKFFSEEALMRYRLKVEVEYFIFLSKKKFFNIDLTKIQGLQNLYKNFNEKEYNAVKKIEKTINHDVKAIELYLKNKIVDLKSGEHKEWVHFGLTSQDINNTSISLLWKDFYNEIYLPLMKQLNIQVQKHAKKYKDIPMLSRTHGQPASATTMGKEWMVFVERIQNQLTLLDYIPHSTKFGGAVGNMNAHYFVFPKYNWLKAHDQFIQRLGLVRQQYTTQVEHYDNLTAKFDTLKRINTILIDFARDIWFYISLDYFKQKINSNEVGSSTMPHKVNPIDFENAEGNFGIANSLFEHFALKLPVSRLQRDLSDSTVLRNIGVATGHTILGLYMLIKGINKLQIHKQHIIGDLRKHPEILAEAIQTLLRTLSVDNPYEKLKDFTRKDQVFTTEAICQFVENLNIDKKMKEKLYQLTVENYIGKFPDF